jgi:hypothetical protein
MVLDRWLQLFLALSAIAAVWIGSFCVVTAARVFASMYQALGWGADLPLPIVATFAVATTVLLCYLFVRRSRYLAACAAISTAGMIAVSAAALSLAVPNYKLCDDVVLWPDWPDRDAATSGETGANRSARRIEEVSC